MTAGRNPMKDRVAIAGAASTGFHARNTGRSQASYVAQACKAVLDQCGLTPRDIDGLCGGAGRGADQEVRRGWRAAHASIAPELPKLSCCPVGQRYTVSGCPRPTSTRP